MQQFFLYAHEHTKSGVYKLPFCPNRIALFGLIIVLFCVSTVWCANESHQKAHNSKAILLVAFGSTTQSGQRALQNIENTFREKFPQTPLYWAYTSSIIKKKLEKKGRRIFSVPEALAQIEKEKRTEVAIQSLHVVPGEEYGELVTLVDSFQKTQPHSFGKIHIGTPLLTTYSDLQEVSEALLKQHPYKKDEAVVWMGHGHEHGLCDPNYLALESELQRREPLSFVGTVEGGLTLDRIVKNLKKNKQIKTVWLSPMMVVSGVHVIEDLIGEEESWKSELERLGYSVKSHLPGMGEIASIASLFTNHLEASLERE